VPNTLDVSVSEGPQPPRARLSAAKQSGSAGEENMSNVPEESLTERKMAETEITEVIEMLEEVCRNLELQDDESLKGIRENISQAALKVLAAM
jgi:hypothetical protein